MKTPSLSQLRKKIDALDAAILEKLNARARLARQVGACKKSGDGVYYVPQREETLLAALVRKNKGPLAPENVRAIYKEIISACMAQQKKLAVAYLGPEATYSHAAALKNFGKALPMLPMPTIPDVFAAVERGEADYGVVPVENSTEGAVLHALDRLVHSDLQIVAQICLPVSQCLLSNVPLAKVRRVVSKDVALGQCGVWLRRHLPNAEWVFSSSTAKAAEEASRRDDTAAVASALAGELYNVRIVARGIQDCAENITRFLVLGKKAPAARAAGVRMRTSIVFSCVKDAVGTLEGALSAFSKRGVNLCKIESRPSREQLWEYYFFIDCIGHRDDPAVKGALAALKKRCPFVKCLGSYPDPEN